MNWSIGSAQITRMMHYYPRINTDTVRVRCVGYDASSLVFESRVCIITREWNDL
ncbi:MAG: hypothetical protein R8G34_13790 [Paracoccaceae bacterium]|nr:hypothetical protein [Paracoccaceae bacterium]